MKKIAIKTFLATKSILPLKICPSPEKTLFLGPNIFSINIKRWIFYNPKDFFNEKKILANVNYKFTAGVIDISGNLPPLSLTPAVPYSLENLSPV
jgi:hypothetical protein